MKRIIILFLFLIITYNSDAQLNTELLGNYSIGTHFNDDFYVIDDLLICGRAYNLDFYDISDSTNPIKFKSFKTQDISKGIAANNDFAFAASSNGITIFNIKDKKNPSLFKNIFPDRTYYQIDIMDSLLIARSVDTIDIIKIIDINNPEIIQSTSCSYLFKFTLDKNKKRLFVLSNSSKPSIFILDISNPSTYQLLGYYTCEIENSQGFFDIIVKDNYIFASIYRGGLIVLDIKDPSNPLLVESVEQDNPRGYRPMALYGNYLYVNFFPFRIFNVENPEKVVQVGTIDLSYNLKIFNNKLFTLSMASILSYDLFNPIAPICNMKIYTPYPNNIALKNNYAFIAGDMSGVLLILDVSNPNSPKEIKRIEFNEPICDIKTDSNYLYLSLYSKYYLQILDITNPDKTYIIGKDSIDELIYPKNFVIKNNHLFLITDSYLLVVDITEPSHPKLLSKISPDYPSLKLGLDVKDNYLFITTFANNSNIDVYDIKDPQNLVKVSQKNIRIEKYSTPYYEHSFIIGNYLFNAAVADSNIFDISSPLNIKTVGKIENVITSTKFAFEKHFLYFTDPYKKVTYIYMLKDSTNPSQIGDYPIDGYNIAVNNNIIYIVNRISGLWIIGNKVSSVRDDKNYQDKSNELLFSPNPASDIINIAMTNNCFSLKILIFSIYGEKVLECEYREYVDISRLSAGIYFVKIGNKVNKLMKI